MNRRKFITTTTATAVVANNTQALDFLESSTMRDTPFNGNIVGPMDGYSTHVGTLVSMMNWMRDVVLDQVRGMSIRELDYVHDEDSNSIGSMLWHLAGTERFYQGNTLDGKMWDGLSPSDSAKWSAASNLGYQGRSQIQGYDIDFYLELLENVRNFTLQEFKNRDDNWIMEVDRNFWSSGTNNYCKWFHVVEHESNHNGQIKYIKKRIS